MNFYFFIRFEALPNMLVIRKDIKRLIITTNQTWEILEIKVSDTLYNLLTAHIEQMLV